MKKYLTVAGKKIRIGPNAVPHTKGSSFKKLIEGLRKASKEGLFEILVEDKT